MLLDKFTVGESFPTSNPATGEIIAQIRIDGPAEVDAAVLRAATAQRQWAATPGAERARILRRAVAILRARNDERRTRDPRYRQADPGDTRRRRASGADCLEYYAGLAQRCRRAPRPRPAGLRLHAPRAARRRGRHRRLELSAADRLLEVRAGAGLRQCDDLQAGRADAAHRDEARGDVLEAGLPAGVFQVVQGMPTPGGC
jgi:hypothetical protein